MHLPFFHRKPSVGQTREYTFSLEINNGYVKSAVWTVVNDRINVISVSSYVKWDTVSAPGLITACDESLSGATAKLDPSGKIQPDKVIFGVSADWVEADKILPDKLRLLKPLTRELGLKAIGFCVFPQAAAKFLHLKESVLPTAIFVGVYPNTIEVTLSRLGKTYPTEIVRRSSRIGADLAEGLTRFKSDNMLPSRMLVYGPVTDRETLRQDILSYAWQSPQNRLPFLHFPKVEILPEDFVIQAISQAGGGEAFQSSGGDVRSGIDRETPVNRPTPAVDPGDLGFFLETDIALQPSASPVSAPVPAPASLVTPSRRILAGPAQFLAGIRFPSVKKFRLKFVFVILLFLLILAGGWFLGFKLNSEITLAFLPETRSFSLDLLADTGLNAADSVSGRLPAAPVSVEVSATESKSTSGSKIVGDRAVGEVTVINGTSVTRIFPAGTVLTSPSGLKFLTDSSIEVASASGTADPNSYQPGKTVVKVTAAAIGSDSNLSAGTQFRVASFSSLDYVAKNDTAFTGGTSRQAQVVAKQDISDLKTEIVASLSETAGAKLASALESGRILVSESVSTQVISETSSHQADEITDTVSVGISMQAAGFTLAVSDLENLISEKINPDIPDGFYQYKPIEYKFESVNSLSGGVEFTVSATAHLLPRLNYEQIKNQIRGMSFSKAETYLKSLPGISSVRIISLPELFSWYKFIPYVTQNIRFVIQPS